MTAGKVSPQVLDSVIVGAGPVGLLLGGELAANGRHVAVLERKQSTSSIPKANGIVGRSAVDLVALGIFDDTGLEVVSPPTFQFGPLTLDLGDGPNNPLHVLPVPQRRLEELLEHRATRCGAQIRRGYDVVDFTQDDVGVTIRARVQDAETLLQTRYLVGCDGAHSFVRKHAGIGFPGFTGDQIARIARVTIPPTHITRTNDGLNIVGIGDVAAMQPNPMVGGSFVIAPVAAMDPAAPADLYLISTHEGRGHSETSSDTATVDELRASLRRVLGADLPFTDAAAIRSTVENSRQADAYQRGRVFLAGDAAHVFNAGGASLNVGLQDAFDLGRRLSTVSTDDSSIRKLNGYEVARRPAGDRALQHTRAQAALARTDHTGHALRYVLETLVAHPTAARAIAEILEDA
jgi:2-polyprenyl-6-methoxyphenol hydroxylase-like FAD-dependent oxidoreductase